MDLFTDVLPRCYRTGRVVLSNERDDGYRASEGSIWHLMLIRVFRALHKHQGLRAGLCPVVAGVQGVVAIDTQPGIAERSRTPRQRRAFPRAAGNNHPSPAQPIRHLVQMLVHTSLSVLGRLSLSMRRI